LKLNHGLGYDWDDEAHNEAAGTLDGAAGTKNRKINKIPFKILDAP